jgi:antitoxin (DNA-binding transcriptional repressor) of toxin-antitoxin stability system
MSMKSSPTGAMHSTPSSVIMTTMRKLEISDLVRLADEVRHGETFELLINGRLVARVEPVPQQTADAWIDDLVRQGVVTRGRTFGKLPEWFFTQPLPQFEGSVVEQLLDDRKSRDW